ncbi:MAG: hypothetical protein WBC82_03925 [Dehalococcoidia bacterium]
MKKKALLLAALALMLAVALTGTAGAGGDAGDTRDVCEIGNITHKVGDTNLNNAVNMGDVTVCIKKIVSRAYDLEVTSDGCCPIEANWTDGLGAPMSGTVLAGETKTFYNIDKDTVVTLSADDSAECAFDSWSGGVNNPDSATTTVTMSADKCVTANCHETVAPYPQPCCWCIYLVEWWQGSTPPGADPPDNIEYFALHCEELLLANHTEEMPTLPDPTTVVISDPSWHQEISAYVGPGLNGYGGLPEWFELTGNPATAPGVIRTNSVLGLVYATGVGYWNSQVNLSNWKSRYNVRTGIGPLVVWAWTMSITPMTGNAGWQYAVGNEWSSIGMSTITPVSTSYHECSGTETVTTPLFPGGIECYRVESYVWDDDGDGVPEAGELTISSTNWYNNDYGCHIQRVTNPGSLYDGWENMYMIHYCIDPPFPPWAP